MSYRDIELPLLLSNGSRGVHGRTMAIGLSVRVETPTSNLYGNESSSTPFSTHSPQAALMSPGGGLRATAGFRRALELQFLHPDAKAEPLTQPMKAFRHSQTSARQEELRSWLVFVALQHDPGSRSNEHIATIQRYLSGSQDVVFAASMPPGLLRRICAGAETAMVDDGKALFSAGEPATTLHVILSGQVKLSRTVSGQARQVGSLGIGRAADYEDFVGVHGVRRTSCHADGTVMVLKLDKHLYDKAMVEHADVEISERFASVASAELFSGLSQKIRLQVAEVLRPAKFRHSTRIAVRGDAADRMWFLRSGSCKVVTTLKRPAQVRGVKIEGWGTKSTLKEVDVIRLQAGDVLGEESIANTKFRPSPPTHAQHAQHSMTVAMDAISAAHVAGFAGHHASGGTGGEDEGAAVAAASTASGGTPAGLSSAGDQGAAEDAEKRYRATAVKYSHTVVADGEVTVYELSVGDLWKVLRAASDGVREAFVATHRDALARRESLHSAQVAEICAVQPVVWPQPKPRPASASSLLVRSNGGLGRAGGPGQGAAAIKPRPATAGPSGGGASGLDARTLLAGAAESQKLRQPSTGAAASAPPRKDSQRLRSRQRPASAAPHAGGVEETNQGRPGSSNPQVRHASAGIEVADPLQKPVPPRIKSSRPSTARASFMRGSIWDHALGGSGRDSAGLEALAAGNGGNPAAASDRRTLEEFMRPLPVDKKKKKKKVLSNKKPQGARRAGTQQLPQTQQQKKNPFLGRRTEWPYVDTLKSRRESTKASGGGAKAARDAAQNVAFWPHCRFDKKAFVLDMPSGSNSAKT